MANTAVTKKPVKSSIAGDTKIWERLKAWTYKNRYFIYAFFIPAIIMAIAYGMFDVYPLAYLFGKKEPDGSVLVLDLNGQYVYYFEAIRDAFWGDQSMLYNWSRNLSGEMMGIIGYYLASPFTLIVILLPRTMLLESLLIMQLVKIGAIGVTFSYYLQKSKKVKPINSLIFSTLFALCAYSVIQLMDPMWIDGLIFLPLIMLGVEYLVDKKYKANYIIPLAIMFIANFYIGYMIAAFTVLYFLYYVFLGSEKTDRSAYETFKIIIRFGISSVIAGMCSAIMILPVYYSLKLGKFEFTQPDFTLSLQFQSIDLLSKLLPSSYDTVRNEGLPEIYSGAITILLLPLFYLNSKIDMKHKIGQSLLLAAMFFSMYIKPIDMAWHGFQVPNWLPYRYSFIVSYIILVMAATAFENIDGIKPSHVGGTFFGILAYLMYAETLKYENIDTLGAIWFTAGCILCFAILISSYKSTEKSKAIPITILILVCGELTISTFETLKDIDKDVAYSKHSSYVDYIHNGREAVKAMEKIDDSLYRSEKVTKNIRRTVNDNMAMGLKGLTHSSSVMNAKMINTLGKLGFVSRGHYTRYNGTTRLTDSLLGIKYVLDKNNGGVDPTYEYVHSTYSAEDEYDKIDLYRNNNALSIGYMVNRNILDADISSDNPFENQNRLMSAMIGENIAFFNKLELSQDPIYNNITVEPAGDQTRYTAGAGDPTIDYTVRAETNDTVYLYFPTVYEKKINLWLGSWDSNEQKFNYPTFLDFYYETEYYCILRVGKFDAGSEFSVRATVGNEYTYMKDQWFYYLDEAVFQKYVDKLKENQWNIQKWSDTYITGDVTAKENQLFFTSIPFEKGWTVKVDGKKVEPIEVAGGFMAVDLSPGQHKVTMKFFPAGMALGIFLSIIGTALVVLFILIDTKANVKFIKNLTKKKVVSNS